MKIVDPPEVSPRRFRLELSGVKDDLPQTPPIVLSGWQRKEVHNNGSTG
jgi:hypothetical protein